MLGKGIRTERMRRGLTQCRLAKLAGLSASAISQIENNGKSPSIDSLRRIATALDVPIFRFLADSDSSQRVVRADQRRTLSFPKSSLVYQALMPDPTSSLEMLYFKLDAGDSAGPLPISHAADECLLVLRGVLEIDVEGDKQTLREGDSIYIASGRRHLVRNVGTEIAEAVFAITPGKF